MRQLFAYNCICVLGNTSEVFKNTCEQFVLFNRLNSHSSFYLVYTVHLLSQSFMANASVNSNASVNYILIVTVALWSVLLFVPPQGWDMSETELAPFQELGMLQGINSLGIVKTILCKKQYL